MFVAQAISDCVGLSPVTRHGSGVSSQLDPLYGINKHQPKENHSLPDLFVWASESFSSLHVSDEVCDIICHLGSGSWCAVFELEHSVMQLPRHSNDHMVEISRIDSEVRVEMLSFGHVHPVWGLEMIPSHDVVDVVDSSWAESDLGEVSWPHSTVRILCLILRVVGWVYMIVDVSEFNHMFTCLCRPTLDSSIACNADALGEL